MLLLPSYLINFACKREKFPLSLINFYFYSLKHLLSSRFVLKKGFIGMNVENYHKRESNSKSAKTSRFELSSFQLVGIKMFWIWSFLLLYSTITSFTSGLHVVFKGHEIKINAEGSVPLKILQNNYTWRWTWFHSAKRLFPFKRLSE